MMPNKAMQFRRALERVLYSIYHANTHHGPIYVSKNRIPLATSGVSKLGLILPRFPNKEELLVTIPQVPPMGWVKTLPAFCADTETIANLANNLPACHSLPKHPLEDVANMSPKVVPQQVSQCNHSLSQLAMEAKPRASHELHTNRRQHLAAIFYEIKGQTRMALSKWHKTFGKLHRMAIGSPDAKASSAPFKPLFSIRKKTRFA
jgi:hypothetical protein